MLCGVQEYNRDHSRTFFIYNNNVHIHQSAKRPAHAPWQLYVAPSLTTHIPFCPYCYSRIPYNSWHETAFIFIKQHGPIYLCNGDAVCSSRRYKLGFKYYVHIFQVSNGSINGIHYVRFNLMSRKTQLLRPLYIPCISTCFGLFDWPSSGSSIVNIKEKTVAGRGLSLTNIK